jgi:energy-coupling factor transporter ATP-binding protein EcfA2
MNPVCDFHLVKVGVCRACGRRTKVEDPGRKDRGKCLNPDCKGESVDMGMTLDGYDIGAAALGLSQHAEPEMTLQDIPAFPAGARNAAEPFAKPQPSGPQDTTPRPGTLPPFARQETDSKLPRVEAVWIENPEGNAPNRPSGGVFDMPTAPEMPSLQKRSPAPYEAPKPYERESAQPAPEREIKSASAPYESPSQPSAQQTPFFSDDSRNAPSQPASGSPFAGGGPRLAQSQKGAAPGAKGSERDKMLEVFEFVREHVLKSETGEFYPIYLLIGLSGAGKTTHLTMLGNILQYREMKYYFPHQGIDIRPVKIANIFDRKYQNAQGEQAVEFRKQLEDRVLDLVYDFSQGLFRSTLAKGLWPEPTPRNVDSTYFLISDVTKDQRIIARLVTFETSGEDFEDAIHAITKLRGPEEAANSLQRIILELMNYAEGFIILIDPANETNNDNIFSNLFLELRLALEPRALNSLYRSVKELLVNPEEELKKIEAGGGAPDLKAVLAAQAEEREARSVRERGIINTKRVLLDKLTTVKHKIETQGVSVILNDREGFIEELDGLMMKLNPNAKRAKELVKEQGFKESQIQSYYIGLIRHCVEHVDKLAVKYYDEQLKKAVSSDASKDPRRIEGAMRLVFEKKGLDPNLRLAPDMSLADDRQVYKFHKLRDIAIVITKSDMYPIVYPPEDYPKFKLPGCKQSIDHIENYLKLIGGHINYYNASTVGYSVLKDTRYYPGAENTFTPINIIEPIFDMLRMQ